MIDSSNSFIYTEPDDRVGYTNEGRAEYYDPMGQPGFKQAAEILAARLPSYYENDPSSGNYRFMGPMGEELQGSGTDVIDVDHANTVQTAESIPQLQHLAKLVDVYHRAGEDIETFRARIIYAFHLVTCRGTIEDLLTLAAIILDVPDSKLSYRDQQLIENGVAQLIVPPEPLTNLSFTIVEFADILNGMVPAGYRLDLISDGRFVYINEQQYADHDYKEENGYAGLNADGEPTRKYNGYAGLL